MSIFSSYQSLWLALASNQRYSPFVKVSDKEYFVERCAGEGLLFLTQGLPSIGKAIDNYHSTTKWVPPSGFETTEMVPVPKDGYASSVLFDQAIDIPNFLSLAIMNALDGNSAAVDCVRQLSYLFYKLEVPYEKEVESACLDQFVSTDLELASFLGDVPEFSPGARDRRSWNADFNRVETTVALMRDFIGRVLCNVDPLDIRPSHGGGATACRTPNWDKYHLLRYFPKLDDVFPYSDYFFFNSSHLVDELEKLEAAPHSDPKARVCLVPKDSRGPRIISCEPAELLFIQQGLMRKLYGTLDTHPLTRGQFNFTDQQINRYFARLGSLNDSWATIDLAEASDRVSLELVRRVFPPRWFEALSACRSESTVLPDGREVKLNKFAPMGSSCCFPVEALVFYACAVAALDIAGMFHHSRNVFVYGDDIITPPEVSLDVIEALESIGLKANRNKCFVHGPFRESCGGDYHLGMDVTPVRLKKPLRDSLIFMESAADFANNLIAKFGYEDSHQMIRIIESTVGYPFPRTLLDLPGTLRVEPCSANNVHFKRRWNKEFQRYEHRLPRLASKITQRHPANWSELLRKELTRGFSTSTPDPYASRVAILDSALDPGQYTDPHAVLIAWRWMWLG